VGWEAARLAAAVVAGRLTASVSRLVGLGGGTTMPGRVARALHPDVVCALASRLERGSVVVTGTNGKTTTARLISHILTRAGTAVVHNRAGANLAAGVAAALVERSSWTGVPRAQAGVFEVDEATLPALWTPLTPRVAVLLNLFRDQLDRYGEIDLLSTRWQAALGQPGGRAAVVYNADDPLVADVGRAYGGPQVPFGIADASCGTAGLDHAADARYCYRCGRPYRYAVVYFGHMGQYHCPRCGTDRPTPAVAADEVEVWGVEGTAFTLSTPGGRRRVRTVLPGLYNVHNVLAASAACLQMGVPLDAVAAAVEEFRPAFGRAERVRVDGREAVLLLTKNPAGFNEVLRTVLHPRSGGAEPVLLVAINDLTADGRDVSWLWDVDAEVLAARAGLVVVSGLRAYDMAVRLKYAGVPDARLVVQPDLESAWDLAVRSAAEGARVYVLPTYTALLGLREILRRRGLVRGFWEE
jgi:UDP-N-acetylmuramyl tripeptide synthase